jgi:hypothetical protein
MRYHQFSELIIDLVETALSTPNRSLILLTSKQLYLAMPFNEYKELSEDFQNKANISYNPATNTSTIKQNVIGEEMEVNIVNGVLGEWGVGEPKDVEKILEVVRLKPVGKNTPVIQMQTLPHRA